MTKAGKVQSNVRFNHTGLSHNGRVFMRGEVVAKESLFINGLTELNQEEQLEAYHQVFYSETDEKVTDPTKFVAESEPQVVRIGPQMAEAATQRTDGMGVSEVGNARRQSLASASVSMNSGIAKEAVLSETPLLPETKKGTKIVEESKTLILKRKIGGTKRSTKVLSENVDRPKKKKLHKAEATKLSSRRA